MLPSPEGWANILPTIGMSDMARDVIGHSTRILIPVDRVFGFFVWSLCISDYVLCAYASRVTSVGCYTFSWFPIDVLWFMCVFV